MPRILPDSTQPGTFGSLRARFGRRYARARRAGRDAKASWERARAMARTTWHEERYELGEPSLRARAQELEELGYQVAFQRGMVLEDAVRLLVSTCRVYQASGLLEAERLCAHGHKRPFMCFHHVPKDEYRGELGWSGIPSLVVDRALAKARQDRFPVISPAQRRASRVARGKEVARG